MRSPPIRLHRVLPWLVGQAILMFARFLTAARPIWEGILPLRRQRIYFANHASNADFVLLWAVLPAPLRAETRPVAASDYWLTTPMRKFVGCDVFNAVLIDRRPEERTEDPVTQMIGALDEGSSLIIFPEGKRNTGEEPLLPFKSGLFHLAAARPAVDLVPVFIRNRNQVMPKGEGVPLPLICTVTFGAPIHLSEGEAKEDFLARARQALLDLSLNRAAA